MSYSVTPAPAGVQGKPAWKDGFPLVAGMTDGARSIARLRADEDPPQADRAQERVARLMK